MNLSFWIIVPISALACLGLLAMQRGENNKLREEIEVAWSSRVVQLSQSPVATQTPSRDNGRTSSKDRVRLAMDVAIELIINAEPETRPELFMLKIMPDFLRAIEDLESHELTTLRDQLIPALIAKDADAAGFCEFLKMALTGLASEEDPNDFFLLDMAKASFDQKVTAFSSLVRFRPEAARQWLKDKNTTLEKKDREYFQNLLVTQLLLHDSEIALHAIRDYGLPEPEFDAKPFLSIPEEQLARLTHSRDLDENGDLRATITQLILRSSFASSIDAARKKAAELELGADDLVPFFKDASRQRCDSKALLTWLVEYPDETRTEIRMATWIWAGGDMEAAASWMETLPPADHRDAAISGFAAAIAELDPEASADWYSQIRNPELRKKFLEKSLKRWRKKDPVAVEVWVNNNKNR